jgi:beta-lactamase class A
VIKKAIEKYITSCNVGICAYEKSSSIFSYNENMIVDAACTLKVFIMLDYVRQIREGTIRGDELLEVTKENTATGAGTIKFLSYGIRVKASDLVELMVAISDHMAANILIDFLGLEHINQTIRMFGFENTRLLKKYIVPKNSHVGEITAHDYARFYCMLDNNEFFEPECCEYMKEILQTQRYKDFLAEPLYEYGDFIDMKSKSGKVDGRTFETPVNSCVNDGGICITKKGNYYIAFLSEIDAHSEVKMSEMKNLMHLVSKQVFEGYIK